jgi:Cytochrome c554 and c-prime
VRERTLSSVDADAGLLVRHRLRRRRGALPLGYVQPELAMSGKNLTPALALAAALLAAGSGGCGRRADRSTISVRLPPGTSIDVREVALSPPDGATSARVDRQGLLVLVAPVTGGRLDVRIPGMCPLSVDPAAGDASVEARPWIDLGGARAQVGFDAPFEVRAVPGCSEAASGEIEWKQLEGPALLDMRADDRGYRLAARTQPFAAVHPEPPPRGIVPFSPRTQGRYVLQATWRREPFTPVQRSITITSIARATGVPSVAVSQQIALGGPGWRIERAPLGSRGAIHVSGDVAFLTVDAPGAWSLVDADGRPLSIRASMHDSTPLDCGRIDCHASTTERAIDTPMSRALEQHLPLKGSAAGAVGCLLDCHTVGERGLNDGGFLDVAASLGWIWTASVTWQDLPRAMRRLAGVRCSSCHGPGAVPEAGARSAILRSDVCATCHDAPPAYVHVQAWRTSRMARADADPATRSDARCARCHTTAGFLADAGIRKIDRASAPEEGVGVACAACHAPHGAHRGEKLVRAVEAPATLGNPSGAERYPESAPCLRCHAPVAGESSPSASAASLVLGRAELPPVLGEEALLAGDAPHRDVPGGCVGCHGGLQSTTGRPTDHSFRVDRASCAICHAAGPPGERPDGRGRGVRAWAQELWSQLERTAGVASSPTPPDALHAHPDDRRRSDPTLVRARYEVELVLEDPAAGVHGAPFARRLLADAEARLGRPTVATTR